MERLTTGRLLLRAFESEDLQSLYAYSVSYTHLTLPTT